MPGFVSGTMCVAGPVRVAAGRLGRLGRLRLSTVLVLRAGG
jgi:hypothetical protein